MIKTGSRVIYSEGIYKNGYRTAGSKEVAEATFHQFGTNYEEFESGPGNYMIAILELDDGQIIEVEASMIKAKQEED